MVHACQNQLHWVPVMSLPVWFSLVVWLVGMGTVVMGIVVMGTVVIGTVVPKYENVIYL